MRRRHFESLQPLCVVCRRDRGETQRLDLACLEAEDDEGVQEGILQCPNPVCRREYPIIDGIPILLRDVRSYVRDHLIELLEQPRRVGAVASLIGDCCGPEAAFNTLRQHLSTYGASHYGDLWRSIDESQQGGGSLDGGSLDGGVLDGGALDGGALDRGTTKTLLTLHQRGRELAGLGPSGPVLDVGCAMGRSSFELACESDQAADRLVLGIDLHFSMLRVASRLAMGQQVTLPRRRSGVVYGGRTCTLLDTALAAGRQRVDFWACDAQDLPFADQTFGTLGALNVVDCLSSPLDGLREMGRVVQHDARAWVSSPYDWSPGATPFEAWLGGHSDRGADGGSSDLRLRSLLEEPSLGLPWRVHAQDSSLPWRLRLHERSVMEYTVDLLALTAEHGSEERQMTDSPETDGHPGTV